MKEEINIVKCGQFRRVISRDERIAQFSRSAQNPITRFTFPTERNSPSLRTDPRSRRRLNDSRGKKVTKGLSSVLASVRCTDTTRRYLGFMREAHKHYELSLEHVLHKNFTSYFSMLRPAFIRLVFELHPFESIVCRTLSLVAL